MKKKELKAKIKHHEKKVKHLRAELEQLKEKESKIGFKLITK